MSLLRLFDCLLPRVQPQDRPAEGHRRVAEPAVATAGTQGSVSTAGFGTSPARACRATPVASGVGHVCCPKEMVVPTFQPPVASWRSIRSRTASFARSCAPYPQTRRARRRYAVGSTHGCALAVQGQPLIVASWSFARLRAVQDPDLVKLTAGIEPPWLRGSSNSGAPYHARTASGVGQQASGRWARRTPGHPRPGRSPGAAGPCR